MANEDLAADEVTAAPPREETRFSRPLRYVVRALVFLALIGFLGYLILGRSAVRRQEGQH